MSDALSSTNVGSLNELFNRDPLQLQTMDLKKIVEHFRSKREQFLIDEAAPKVAKPRASAVPKVVKQKVSLDDLSNLDFS